MRLSRIVLVLRGSSRAAPAWSAAAMAADYDPPIFVDDSPEYVPVEVGSGWYLRGDIGYIAKQTDTGTPSLPHLRRSPRPTATSSFDTSDRSQRLHLRRRRRLPLQRLAARRRHGRRLPLRFAGTTTSAAPCDRPAGTSRRLERPAAPKTGSGVGRRPSASWPTAMSTSAPSSVSRPMSAPASATAYAELERDLIDDNQTYCVGGGHPDRIRPSPPRPPFRRPRVPKDWRFTYALDGRRRLRHHREPEDRPRLQVSHDRRRRHVPLGRATSRARRRDRHPGHDRAYRHSTRSRSACATNSGRRRHHRRQATTRRRASARRFRSDAPSRCASVLAKRRFFSS